MPRVFPLVEVRKDLQNVKATVSLSAILLQQTDAHYLRDAHHNRESLSSSKWHERKIWATYCDTEIERDSQIYLGAKQHAFGGESGLPPAHMIRFVQWSVMWCVDVRRQRYASFQKQCCGNVIWERKSDCARLSVPTRRQFHFKKISDSQIDSPIWDACAGCCAKRNLLQKWKSRSRHRYHGSGSRKFGFTAISLNRMICLYLKLRGDWFALLCCRRRCCLESNAARMPPNEYQIKLTRLAIFILCPAIRQSAVHMNIVHT